MNFLQTYLQYNKQEWSANNALKYTLRDFLFSFEKCAWCRVPLHRGKNRPTNMTYWKEPDGSFVCANCHYTHEHLSH